MANGTPGWSVQNTTSVALPTTAGVIVLQWLVHPVWPPPTDVLTIACGAFAPIAHLVGRGIYAKVNKWLGAPPPEPEAAPPAAAAPP